MKTKTYILGLVGLTFCVYLTAPVLPGRAQPEGRTKNQQETPPKAQAQTETKTQSQSKAEAKVQSQAKGHSVAQPAETKASMAGPGKWVPADLEFSGHRCTVLLPGDYRLDEFIDPAYKVFCFKGPQHPDKTTALFNVTIQPSTQGARIPGERELMDVMLNPHRHSLTNYKEQKEPLFTNGGHSFKGMSFSGTKKDGQETKDRRGFIYLTQDRDTFFILFGSDEEPFADHSLPLLLKTATGCQIKNQ